MGASRDQFGEHELFACVLIYKQDSRAVGLGEWSEALAIEKFIVAIVDEDLSSAGVRSRSRKCHHARRVRPVIFFFQREF